MKSVLARRAARLGCAVVLAIAFQPLPAVEAAGKPRPVATTEACPPTPAGVARCFAQIVTGSEMQPNAIKPNDLPSGYGPADLVSAYALPSVGKEGTGLTVAVVDAFDAPTAESDLAAYRTMFGLPDCTKANGCFTKVNEQGLAGPLPDPDPSPTQGWAYEVALDLQMVSAICPNCKLLLVEANTANAVDLAVAEASAVRLGAMAVSNSYGAVEMPGEVTLDNYYNHPGVAIVASTGDCGYNCGGAPEYPAASPYVVAVGGTTLYRDTNSRGWSELAWAGAGSGCSVYEPMPTWQFATGCAGKTVADVAAVADPSPGLAVNYAGIWRRLGGTSAAAPIIAAIYALAGGPATTDYAAQYLYATRIGLNDVVGGNNDLNHSCAQASLCNGVIGQDGPTGLGSPAGLASFKKPQPSTYHPLSSAARLLDTRVGTGLPGPSGSQSPRLLTVTGGVIPDDATAVTGNLTVTGQTSKGWLYIGPDSAPIPNSSTLNFPVGDDRANNVTVMLLTGSVGGVSRGMLWVDFSGATGSNAQVVFDATGYFSPDNAGASYHPVSPTRILDTRNGTGLAGRLYSAGPRPLQVKGTGVVPDNAVAVTGNLTVTNQGSLGWLYIGPDYAVVPASSNLNFPVGDNRANGVTARLDPNGALWLSYVTPSGNFATDVVFDLTGYYTADLTGDAYVGVNPTRILDTRVGAGLSGPFKSMSHRTFNVVGGTIPPGTTAVTGNLTVTQQQSKGWLYVGPQTDDRPGSSTLNFPYGDDRSNGVTVGANGSILSATYVAPSFGPGTQVIFDLTGYFTKAGPLGP